MPFENTSPVYGPTNPAPEEVARQPVKRFAAIIGLLPEKAAYYRDLHANVWPSVLQRLRRSHIRNYSIHLAEIGGQYFLVSHYEYIGMDHAADMHAIAADPETQRWWLETDPCQFRLPTCPHDENWTPLECLFWMER